jgi:hypothetical protein
LIDGVVVGCVVAVEVVDVVEFGSDHVVDVVRVDGPTLAGCNLELVGAERCDCRCSCGGTGGGQAWSFAALAGADRLSDAEQRRRPVSVALRDRDSSEAFDDQCD